MANLTNIARHNASMTGISKALTGGRVFYVWLFWFTISSYETTLTNVSKNTPTITNIAKS